MLSDYLILSWLVSPSYALDYSQHLATKSSYFSYHRLQFPTPSADYKLVQIQLISRHGTRNPSPSDIESFRRLEKISDNINSTSKFSWLKRWKSHYKSNENLLLTGIGEKDLYYLGKRARERYHLISESKYSPLKFSFHSSLASRASQSASAFSIGLFEGSGHLTPSNIPAIFYETYSKDEDFILESKGNCPYWGESVKDDEIKADQLSRYTKSKIQPIASRISQTIGFKVETADVRAMYKYCAFDIALQHRTATWCQFLTPADILDLEYLEDLGYYYKYSYGNAFNGKMACVLVTKFIENIENYSRNKSQLIGDFQFGHSQTIQFLLTALGLFKDPFLLTWDLDENLKRNRMFRTSQVVPFASNIFVELYRYGINAELKVRFLINEAPIKLPNCDMFCPFKKLKTILKQLLKCDYKHMCQVKNAKIPSQARQTYFGNGSR
ncbi:hypothetical protein DSO57_1030175 [Entomophthora muscae]|uniref:Uncharacterized protein n=1 Tax=Entomophthora muscae TaxID=34485 RepID=A0ACC2TZA5_9FUNG|nr:hypothetical protein DSO57_1030175 [Entomophthora muscae]